MARQRSHSTPQRRSDRARGRWACRKKQSDQLMREHALNPKQRRRFIATTDSDHNYPIFPNLAKNMKLDGPNQLWVADITYVTIATGFVYLAAILDAWSRRVVGYAISRSIDARLAVGRYSRPSPLHRPGLQHPQTPLRARISEPSKVSYAIRYTASTLSVFMKLSALAAIPQRSEPPD